MGERQKGEKTPRKKKRKKKKKKKKIMSAQKEIEFLQCWKTIIFGMQCATYLCYRFRIHARALFSVDVIFSFHFVDLFFRLYTGSRHHVNFGNRNKNEKKN